MNAYNLFGAVHNELHAALARRRQMELCITRPDQALIEHPESTEQSPNQSNFTCGPVDGSLYATVAKPRLSSHLSSPSPNHPSNLQRTPNHRSLDSGICSSNGEPSQPSPNHSQTPQSSIQPHPLPPSPSLSNHISFIGHHSIAGAHQLPPTPAPSRSSTGSESHHRPAELPKPISIDLSAAEQELDQLLESMLLELQSIPDCPFDSQSSSVHQDAISLPPSSTVAMAPTESTPNDAGIEDDQPMSPRFLKRPLQSSAEPVDNALNGQPTGQPFSYGVAHTSPAIQRRRALSERTEYVSDGRPRASSAEPTDRYDLLYTESSTVGGDSSNWLERQQAKLANRQQGRSMSERRANERQLLNELRGTVATKHPAANQPAISNQSQPIEQPLHVEIAHDPPTNDTTFRTVHTRKRTGVRSDAAPRTPSPGPVLRHSTPASMTIDQTSSSLWSPSSVNSTRLSSNGAESPLYASIGTGSPTPSSITHHVINRQERHEQDEVDNLIRTLATEQHSYLPAMQSTPIRNETANVNQDVVGGRKVMLHPTNNNVQFPSGPTSSNEVNNNSISIPLNHNVYGLVGKPDMSHNDVTIVPATYLELKRQQLTKEQPLRCHSVAATSRATSIPYSPPTCSSSLSCSATRTNPNSPAPGSRGPLEDSRSMYANQSQRSSMLSLADSEPLNLSSRFYRDTTHLWYRPNISREEATKLLKQLPVGSFLVRDSRSFPGSFGLMLRVAQAPAISASERNGGRRSLDPTDELVRHFLIEPTTKGVRIKGCANEPVFASMSALIYQHTCTPLALPCKLLLPESAELAPHPTLQRLHSAPARTQTPPPVADGAGCNVLYLTTVDVESLTGPQAIKRAVETWLELTHEHERRMAGLLQQVQTANKGKDSKTSKKSAKDKENKSSLTKESKKDSKTRTTTADSSTYEPFVRDSAHRSSLLCSRSSPQPIVVYFKVSSKGITLTDNTHRLFFRRHYTSQSISHCGVDTEDRKFTHMETGNVCRFFGFVARVPGTSGHNECHLFAEHDQPASVIISYVNKYVFTQPPILLS